jgi:hypothetical protein
MSDGRVYIGTDDNTTFRDLERKKWEAAREDCPCRCGSYCNVSMGSFCEMKDCPFLFWKRANV